MRLTKGKQKIQMKKVEAYAYRMITFSKRKSGIFKKMNEIVSLCDVEMAFLVFSESGKPYTFAYPSMNEMFGRLMSPLRHGPTSESINIGPIVEAYKRQKMQDLMQKYIDLVEELEMENDKEKILQKSKLEKMWWNIPTEGFSVEELKWMRQTFVELHVSLGYMALKRFGKAGDGSSSSQESCGGDGESYA